MRFDMDSRGLPGIAGVALGMIGVGLASFTGLGFIDPSGDYADQFAVLASTFSVLMLMIHSLYCVAASLAKERLLSPRWSNVLSKVTGGVFVGLGIGAAAATK
jgi:threonine/homoserine/homoserine lactone efflux protein